MKKYYYIIRTLILMMCSFSAFAQPANDECVDAIDIAVGTTCQTVYTNVGATLGAINGGTGCGNANSGVWFRFVATNTVQRIYLSNYTSTFNPRFRVFSGTCGALVTELNCENTNGNGGNETADITGLTNGDTYYIRVTGNDVNRGNFCLQVFDPTPPNDECINATPLTMNALCTNGSINSATNNPTDDLGGCGDASRTVWYSFVATSSNHQIFVKNEDANLNQDFAVYSGSCGTLTELFCESTQGDGRAEVEDGNSFIPGQTYFVRVNGNTSTDVGNFCVRVIEPPTNNCFNPTVLPTDGTCVSGYTNLGATDGLNPGCVFSGGGPTAWYTFTATSSEHTVVLDVTPVASSNNENLGFTVYSGSCAALTQITCTDFFVDDLDERRSFTGLTPTQTYYIRVTGFQAANQGAFCIKVLSPPTNDECGNAINLIPNSSCTSGYNYNNLNTEGISGDCVTNDNFVWYSFVATSTEHTIRLTNVSRWANLGFRVLSSSGTCAVVNLDCEDDNGDGGSESLTLPSLTPGSLYYIAVGGDDATDQGEFCISIEAPPFNDLCENARELVVDNPCFSAVSTGATDDGVNPNPSCGNDNATVWFRFNATSTSHTISLDNREMVANGTEDFVVSVYETSDNTCSGVLTELSCVNDEGDLGGESTTLTGLSVGQTYFVMVSGRGATDEGTFCISVTQNVDECSNAISLIANSECISGSNRGTSTSGATDGTCNTPERTAWYSYTPNFSSATLTIDPAGDFNAEVTVFSATGTCAGLAEIECQDNGGVGGVETVLLSDMTPGSLYYIMVDGQAGDQGTFCISIREPLACGSNPLPSNTCDAAPLINNLDGYCGFTNFEYTPNFYNNLQTGPNFCTNNDIENNSFLRFTADAEEVFLELNIVTSSPNGGPPCFDSNPTRNEGDTGIQLEVYSVSGNDCTTGIWTPVTLSANGDPNIDSDCVNPSGGVGSAPTSIRLSDLVPGDTYYIMFDGYGGDECGFVIRAPFGGGVLLPLNLLSFNATVVQYGNLINWEVVPGYNQGEQFWIERSTNQMQFETLGELDVKSGQVQYQFLDDGAHEKRDYYYRLRTIDAAGKYHFSNVILVHDGQEIASSEQPIHIYPNPTSDVVNIDMYAPVKTGVVLQLIDLQGRVVKSFDRNVDSGNNIFQMPLNDVKSGLYIIRVKDRIGSLSYSEKIIKR